MDLAAKTSARGRWLARGAALGLGLGLGASALAGCPLQLERGLSCGDGWWDPEFEECDPRDPNESHLNACRDQGFASDAKCDPQTCEILDAPADCNICGDGMALGDEACDGEDLRGESCAGGSGILRCTDSCTLDYDECPVFCGDNVVSGDEECEPAVLCASDDDCVDDRVCFDGNCLEVGEGFAPYNACSNYETTAVGISKPYASGTIAMCGPACTFGRNNCSFCGDGELDLAYDDFVSPGGGTAKFPEEVCDGDEADEARLAMHCEPLCVDDAINSDVVVLCEFECSDDCLGFAVPGDVVPPDPESLGCCLAKDSPCPKFETEGVPDFPCCSWLDKPEWAAEQKCVASSTGQIPVTLVCP